MRMLRGLLLGCLLAAGVLLVAGCSDDVGDPPRGDVAVADDGAVRQDLSAVVRLDGENRQASEGDAGAPEDGAGAAPAESADPAERGVGEPDLGAPAEAEADPGTDLASGVEDLPDEFAGAASIEAAAEHGELIAHLTRVFRRHGPPGTFGLAVADAEGRLVYDRHADRPLIPASTQKLVTAAVALETLGPDHRLRTEAHATGPVEDGILRGDLVVVGGGDPALGDPQWGRVVPRRPRTPLEALAAQIADAGVTEIHGQVVGLATVLPWQPEAPGWPSRYFAQGNTTRSSGLTVNGGRRLRERGGAVRGDPAGSPALETARRLQELLPQRGVLVAGQPGVVNQHPGSSATLAAVESPPVVELLRHTVQHSDNHLADGLWRVAGLREGDGSWGSGGEAAVAVLNRLGVDLGPARFADGSGLSRENRLTARLLAVLDQRMTTAHGARWAGLEAVAAESGTLRRRLHGTVAAGALRGKTGSLRDVRALAGSVDGPQGRWHFALLAGDLDGAAIRRFRRLTDDLAIVLARHTHGCDLSGC